MIISQSIIFAGASINAYVLIPEGARIESCWLMLESTLVAHAVNYLTFNVRGSNGTSAIVTARTTDTGASGTTITAKTSEQLTLINADKQSFAAGEYIALEVTQGGTVTANKVVFGMKLAFDRD